MIWLLCCLLVVALQSCTCLRLNPHVINPADNPVIQRHSVKPPVSLFSPTRFCGYRGLGSWSDLEKYASTGLGDIVWPTYEIFLQSNATMVLQDLKRRGLALVDVWDYVPGDTDVCGPLNGNVCEYHIDPTIHSYVLSVMGDSFTGMDNGEQDGRYIGGYASQMQWPVSSSSVDQYLHLAEHFQRMTDDLGGVMAGLNSLYFPHYFSQTGLYTMAGAETAQGLPNAQLFYSFLRGAGKQYGVMTFGQASVYNRWGYKQCNATACTTSGSSLALLARLMVNQLLMGQAWYGFESALLDSNWNITPLGKISLAGKALVQSVSFGTFLVSTGVVMDFFGGFVPPRHLYTDNVFRRWGNKQYRPTDHFIDNVFRMFYPTYADSSFFHNERGFQSPTPYGDSLDALLSDAPQWLLNMYPVLIATGPFTAPIETVDKLLHAAAQGSTVVISIHDITNEEVITHLTGCSLGYVTTYPANTTIQMTQPVTRTIVEPSGFDIRLLRDCSSNGEKFTVVAKVAADGVPTIIMSKRKNGTVWVLLSSGVTTTVSVVRPIVSMENKPLPNPYPLLLHVNQTIDVIVSSQTPLIPNTNTSYATTRVGPGEYLLMVANPTLAPLPIGPIQSNVGDIDTVTEIALNVSQRGVLGYFPEGFEHATIGEDTATVIAGLNVRLFRIHIKQEVATFIPSPAPEPIPRNMALPVNKNVNSLVHYIRTQPTLLQSYDTIVVPSTYVEDHDISFLQNESKWLRQQKVRVVVDCTVMIDLYPNGRLVQNSPTQFQATIQRLQSLIQKACVILSNMSCEFMIPMHRTPENYYSDDQTMSDFVLAMNQIASYANTRGATIVFKYAENRTPQSFTDLTSLLKKISAPNVMVSMSAGRAASEESQCSCSTWPLSGVKLHSVSFGGLLYDTLTFQRLTSTASLTELDPNFRSCYRSMLSSVASCGTPLVIVDTNLGDVGNENPYLEMKMLNWLRNNG